MCKAIPYRMYSKIRNCGDAINPFVIEHVTGLPAYHVYQKNVPHVLGIGSVMSLAGPESYVWGSGIRDPRRPLPRLNAARIKALRGQHTYSLLRERGIVLGDVAFGDPGVFVDELINISQIKKTHQVALVPNHADTNHRAFRKLARDPKVKMVNMMDNSLDPLLEIARSELVISQSLHGLIFAEALGIPNVWVTRRNDDSWKFKFRDWYSVTHEPNREPMHVEKTLEEMIANARVSGIHEGVKEGLRHSFPWEAGSVRKRNMIDHISCRRMEAVFIKISNRQRISRSNFSKILEKVYSAAEHLSYPLYTLVGHANVSGRLLFQILEVMDSNPDCSFGTILDQSEAPLSTWKKKNDLFYISELSPTEVGHTLIIRPDRSFDPDGKMMMFYLPRTG